MKNTKKKLKNQSKIVKTSFTGSNITRYSGLNTVAKYMNRQNIVKSISTSSPTVWHNATRVGINQTLMAITLSSISGISRICRIAAFSGDRLVRAILWQLSVFAYNISVMMRQKKNKFKQQEHRTFIDWFILVPAKITMSEHQIEIKMYEHHFYKKAWEELDKLIEAA